MRSFRDAATKAVFDGLCPKGFPADLLKVSRRKLRYLHNATELRDLRALPGNRLEALKGSRAGQHSIRVNDRVRVSCGPRTDRPRLRSTDYH